MKTTVIVASVFAALCVCVASAFAGVVPDPIASPSDAMSLLVKLWHGGALIAGGILVAFFGLTVASRKISWLQEDHRAVYVAAILGGLALLAVPAADGNTPNLSMILSAVIAAIGLAINPAKPAVDAAARLAK